MSRWANDSVLDALLDKIATATKQYACTQQPTNFAEASETYAVAEVAMDAGDFSKSNGVSGRQMEVAVQNNVPVTGNGTITHLALCDGSSLLYATVTNSKIVEAGDQVNMAAHTINVKDPVATV